MDAPLAKKRKRTHKRAKAPAVADAPVASTAAAPAPSKRKRPKTAPAPDPPVPAVDSLEPLLEEDIERRRAQERERKAKAAAARVISTAPTEDEGEDAAPVASTSSAAALEALAGGSTAQTPVAELNTAWSAIDFSPSTRKAIDALGFERMTEIQARAIPPLLAGRDLLGAARTGSGKTLAFLLPAIEMLSRLRFKPRNGALALHRQLVRRRLPIGRALGSQPPALTRTQALARSSSRRHASSRCRSLASRARSCPPNTGTVIRTRSSWAARTAKPRRISSPKASTCSSQRPVACLIICRSVSFVKLARLCSGASSEWPS